MNFKKNTICGWFALYLLLWLCPLLQANDRGYRIVFGIMEYQPNQKYWKIIFQTREIPMMSKDQGMIFGVIVDPKLKEKYTLTCRLSTIGTNAKSAESEEIETYEHVGVPFSFEEEDPLGLYILDVFINGNLEETITFDVVESKYNTVLDAIKDYRNSIAYSDRAYRLATDGYELYKNGEIKNVNGNSVYVDPDEESQVYDVRITGPWMEVDRNDDGFHETIFRIIDEDVRYFGSLGSEGRLVDVGGEYEEYLNQKWNNIRYKDDI